MGDRASPNRSKSLSPISRRNMVRRTWSKEEREAGSPFADPMYMTIRAVPKPMSRAEKVRKKRTRSPNSMRWIMTVKKADCLMARLKNSTKYLEGGIIG